MYSAFMGGDADAFEAVDRGGVTLTRYSAVADGAGLDDSGEYLVLVLVNQDETDATADAASLDGREPAELRHRARPDGRDRIAAGAGDAILVARDL